MGETSNSSKKAAWMALIPIGIVLSGGLIGYGQLQTQVGAAKDDIETNQRAIIENQKAIQELGKTQGQIQTRQEYEQRTQQRFRGKTDRSLEKILDRLYERPAKKEPR